MAYTTASQAMALIDNRLLGDLVSDSGQRVTPSGLLTDPNLATALSTAAGQINSAALVGQRYTVAELKALTGDDAAFLVMLNTWLAFGILCSRRGRDAKEHPEYVKATEMLETLKTGEAVFNVAADVSVGTAQTSFPSFADYATVNSLRERTGHYFPVRPVQNPTPLGG